MAWVIYKGNSGTEPMIPVRVLLGDNRTKECHFTRQPTGQMAYDLGNDVDGDRIWVALNTVDPGGGIYERVEVLVHDGQMGAEFAQMQDVDFEISLGRVQDIATLRQLARDLRNILPSRAMSVMKRIEELERLDAKLEENDKRMEEAEKSAKAADKAPVSKKAAKQAETDKAVKDAVGVITRNPKLKDDMTSLQKVIGKKLTEAQIESIQAATA